MSTVTARRSSDLLRQIVVLSAVTFMLIAAMVGVGLFGGTAVQDLQGGALDSDASYLAPASSAFSIWSVIYIGLIAYAIWQALPGQRTNDRQRALGWLVAVTAVLNGVWLVVAQYATLPLTVVAIVALLVALAITFRRAVSTRSRGDGAIDAILLDGVTGLHLGWVTVATVANTAALLTQSGPESWASAADVLGVVVLIVVGAIGLGIAFASTWRVTPSLAIGWGVFWLGIGRLGGEPSSTVIGVTAMVVAAIVVLVPLIVAALRLIRPSTD